MYWYLYAQLAEVAFGDDGVHKVELLGLQDASDGLNDDFVLDCVHAGSDVL